MVKFLAGGLEGALLLLVEFLRHPHSCRFAFAVVVRPMSCVGDALLTANRMALILVDRQQECGP